jgi:hypothetical protein
MERRFPIRVQPIRLRLKHHTAHNSFLHRPDYRRHKQHDSSWRSTPSPVQRLQQQICLRATQQPFADVSPTGNVHLTIAPGNVLDAIISPIGFAVGSRAFFTTTLPAGARTFSAQYDGDNVYQAGSITGSGPVTIAKGTIGFTLTAGKRSTRSVNRSPCRRGFNIPKYPVPRPRVRSHEPPGRPNFKEPPSVLTHRIPESST